MKREAWQRVVSSKEVNEIKQSHFQRTEIQPPANLENDNKLFKGHFHFHFNLLILFFMTTTNSLNLDSRNKDDFMDFDDVDIEKKANSVYWSPIFKNTLAISKGKPREGFKLEDLPALNSNESERGQGPFITRKRNQSSMSK